MEILVHSQIKSQIQFIYYYNLHVDIHETKLQYIYRLNFCNFKDYIFHDHNIIIVYIYIY